MTRPTRSSAIISDDTFQSVGDTLMSFRTPLLLSHERPDPDALGCLLAMRSVLAAVGRHPVAVLYEPCPRRYEFLPEVDQLQSWDRVRDQLACDCVLVLDTCAVQQVRPAIDFIRGCGLPVFAVDHHVTRDLDVHHALIDEHTAAASLIVYRWAQVMGWPVSVPAATALLAGIIGDTGWFRFDNTDADTLRAAADLLDAGVDLDWLHQQLHQNEPPSTIRLRAAALSAVRFYRDDAIAVVPITGQMYADTGAAPADSENLVNEPLAVGTVQASVVLVEMSGGLVKCSFRSKGAIDVAAIARSFGGGGHVRAAGARIEGTLATAEQRVVARLSAAISA